MKKRILHLTFFPLLSMISTLHAQNNKSAVSNKVDSLASEFLQPIPVDLTGHLHWPFVIRGLMKSNLDSNFNKILALKKRYSELVPTGYEVYIFFTDTNSNRSGETFDITIRRKGKRKKEVYANWIDGMDPHNNKSARLIKASLGWDYTTIMEIRRLLTGAKCIGIENSKVTCIYYMPGYRYLFFPKELTAAQEKKFDDQIRFFFYGKNIVIDSYKKSAESYPLREPS